MAQTIIKAEAGSQEIKISRTFDANREALFSAYTSPDAIVKWLGPRRLTTRVDKMETKPGGMWRYVQTDENGIEFAFHGVYHLLDKPSQIVDTFEYEGLPERHVAMETVTFTDHNGKTTVTVTTVFQSVQDRDAMIASGMESGVTESMERLSELLAGA